MNSAEDLVFVAAQRTPFGAFGGSFAQLTAVDLGYEAARAALQKANIEARDIEATIFGNVIQSCPNAAYLARHIGLRVGAPEQSPALTVNRLCGSGFEAIVQAAHLILGKEARTVLAGGSENMSETPYVVREARWGSRMGSVTFEDLLSSGLTDAHVQLPMAMTAENLAERYGLSREVVDRYALSSQQRAAAAWESGAFEDEVCAVEVSTRKGSRRIERDEHLKPDTTLEILAKLKPVFKKEGVVTAGNASGITDGAAAVVLTSRDWARSKGWRVLGSLKAWAARGCDPRIMGIGPVPATHAALEHYERLWGVRPQLKDMRLVEVNEAFSAQYLAVEKELGLSREITNIHGGAIALGHPLAASGTRLVTHLLYALKKAGGGLGLASACIGGGQGMSLIIEVSDEET